jgi:hypothetical protein
VKLQRTSETYYKGNCHDHTAGLEVAPMAREELSKGPSARDRSDLWIGSHRIRKNPLVGTFWSPIAAVFITVGAPEAAAMSAGVCVREKERERQRTKKERWREERSRFDIYAGISERVCEVRDEILDFGL